MSGGYAANAGGIFVSGTTVGTPEEVDRHINLIIYQLASSLQAKDYGATLQSAAKHALGGEPQPGEIQATPLTESDPAGYFATNILK